MFTPFTWTKNITPTPRNSRLSGGSPRENRIRWRTSLRVRQTQLLRKAPSHYGDQGLYLPGLAELQLARGQEAPKAPHGAAVWAAAKGWAPVLGAGEKVTFRCIVQETYL